MSPDTFAQNFSKMHIDWEAKLLDDFKINIFLTVIGYLQICLENSHSNLFSLDIIRIFVSTYLTKLGIVGMIFLNIICKYIFWVKLTVFALTYVSLINVDVGELLIFGRCFVVSLFRIT